MPEDIVITGLEQMAILGKRLKVAGAVDLRRELLRGLREAAKPLVADAKQAARDQLPKAGGLNQRVAGEPMSIRNRLTGSGVGVRIVTTTTDTRGSNRGVIRHPVFGHTNQWVSQPYEPGKGWFSDTLAKRGPDATKQVLEVMAFISIELTRKA